MKKVMIAAVAVLMMSGAAFAQDAMKKEAKMEKKDAKMMKHEAKKAGDYPKAEEAKMEKKDAKMMKHEAKKMH